jgi:hypothetical protein
VEYRCPHCGAELYALGARECWMCRGPLTPQEDLAEQVVLHDVPKSSGDNPLLVVGGVLLLLVGVGLTIEAPGLGLLLLVLATPVLIRVAHVADRRQAHGAPMTGGEKVLAFLGSLGVVAAVGLAAAIAFFAACFAVCFAGLSLGAFNSRGGMGFLFVAWACGGVAGLFVFVLLWRRLWRRVA